MPIIIELFLFYQVFDLLVQALNCIFIFHLAPILTQNIVFFLLN